MYKLNLRISIKDQERIYNLGYSGGRSVLQKSIDRTEHLAVQENCYIDRIDRDMIVIISEDKSVKRTLWIEECAE